MFARVEGDIALSALYSCRGVLSVVGEVSQSEIIKLRKLENERGLIDLSPPKPKLPQFDVGQSVVTKDGLFDNAIGIYEGMSDSERCRVLFEMMGRHVAVHIKRENLIAAPI
jgi:transcription antitermination factor NusG